ncbi:MAG: MarR family transcriptional regulator [Bacteroidetes bacterium]|nr:MarR family transcriptional regulator [Bacteroidota bacterium]
MRLEEEIKQKKFKNEYHRLGVNIMFTGAWLKQINIQGLKKFGLTSEQYNVLRILRGQHPKPASVNLIIERMIDKSSNSSRIVERLRIKGFLERNVCPHDRRQVDVVITDKALKLLAVIDEEEFLSEKPLQNLNEEEAEALSDLLDKLRG